jgi:aarF domain-containing kinase
VVPGVLVAAYGYDYAFKYQRFHRNVRSLVGAVATVYDYKVEWQRTTTLEEQSVIHDRVAKRWFDICSENGGLYVKIGQAVTTGSHVMPPEFATHFSKLHDQAPQVIARATQ